MKQKITPFAVHLNILMQEAHHATEWTKYVARVLRLVMTLAPGRKTPYKKKDN